MAELAGKTTLLRSQSQKDREKQRKAVQGTRKAVKQNFPAAICAYFL